jgi:hypothetical protein
MRGEARLLPPKEHQEAEGTGGVSVRHRDMSSQHPGSPLLQRSPLGRKVRVYGLRLMTDVDAREA